MTMESGKFKIKHTLSRRCAYLPLPDSTARRVFFWLTRRVFFLVLFMIAFLYQGMDVFMYRDALGMTRVTLVETC